MVGTPCRQRDPLRLDELGKALGRQVRARHDQVGPAGHGRMGEPPGVGVEHRHDGQHPVLLDRPEAPRREHAVRVQERRPVAVHDALGVAGRAARVAHGRRLVLVRDVEVDGLGAGDQLLVVVDLLAGGWVGDLAGAVVHDHEMANRLEGVEQRPHQLGQRAVDEDHLVLRVVGHVRQLVREQTDVEGVEHPVGARCREVELEVPGCVPAERGDPAVGADPELVEHAAKTAGAVGPLAIRHARLPGRRDRHHLLVEEQALGPRVEVGQRERKVLHQPLHRAIPLVVRRDRRA